MLREEEEEEEINPIYMRKQNITLKLIINKQTKY